MDRSFFSGLVRDWGIALLVAVAVFAVWKLVVAGPVASGRVENVQLVDLSGREIDLSSYYGGNQPIVLNFWATWCGPCIQEIPEFVSYQSNHPDITVLGISVDENKSLGALKAFAKRKDMNYTVLHDDSRAATNAFGIQTLPTTYVLSPDGTIEQVRVGAITEVTLDRMVQAAQ